MANKFQSISHLQFALLLVVATITFASSSTQEKFTKSEVKEGLVHLGHADGVDYYAEETLNMNWYEARDYCQANNMTLAKIIGRPLDSPNCFVWNDMPNTHPSIDVITLYNLSGAVAMEVCGAILAYSPELEMRAYLCRREWVFPLCQK